MTNGEGYLFKVSVRHQVDFQSRCYITLMPIANGFVKQCSHVFYVWLR